MIWLFRSTVVLLAYLGMNLYSGLRFLGFIRFFLPAVKAYVFWPVHIILCYSFILIMLLRLDRIQALRQAGMYSLPFYVYFFMALLAMDIPRIVLQNLERIPRFPIMSVAGCGIALALAIFAMVYGTIHARNIRTVHYDLVINKSQAISPHGLKITLVSDLHIGAVVGRKWVANIVDAINKTEPDIILITGDIFDNSIDAIRDPQAMIADLRRLNAPLGVYACPGNHDVDRLSWGAAASTDRIYDFLKRANILLLRDEVNFVADSFYLAGRKDARPIGLRQERKTAAELTAGLDKSRPIIFMDHQPVDFPGIEEAGADLILSGHTHRGQFFPGNLATTRIFRRAGATHYGHWQGASAQGIVTSGAAIWGPAIRIASHSEVVVLNVQLTLAVQRAEAHPERVAELHSGSSL